VQIGILESKDFSKIAEQNLKKLGEVSYYNEENLNNFLVDKDILFVRLKYKIDKEFLKISHKLKYLCTPTTGLNHIDLEECKKYNIKVISLKGEYEFLSSIRATPEHSFGLLLALLRNYKSAFLNTTNTDWDRDKYKGFEIYGKTIGIIGMGRVGKLLSKYLEVFGASIVFIDINKVDIDSENVHQVENLESLINLSDIIFLTASYSKENRHMIDKRAIDLMKNKFFINTSRGELIDEDYLIEKIEQNHFKGIALDVISNEVMQINKLNKFLPLTKTNNFIITPHIGGATYESMWKTEEFIVNKLIEGYL
jgi:D-3-phosphoglycerate dehydrogenase